MAAAEDIAVGKGQRDASVLPDARCVRLYLLWAGVVGVAFFAIYPTLNWFTSLRPHRFQLYVEPELGIPFVPQFIWVYLSTYVLFLVPLFLLPSERMPTLGKQLVAGTVASGVMFLLLPAELGFARVIPSNSLYASLYRSMFSIDRPHNLVPSLHVVWSCAIALACIDAAGSLGRALLGVWLSLLVGSTVLVHQHHILDVISAFLFVFLLRRCYGVPNAQVLSRRHASDRGPDLRCGRG